MRIACGFHNGIGNGVQFTSVLKALHYYSQEPTIDAFLDEIWVSNSSIGKAVFDIYSHLDFVNVKLYPSEFKRENYDVFFMSRHSVFTSPVHEEFLGINVLDISKYPNWAQDFLSEISFYYLELVREIGYKGPIFSQTMPYDKDFHLPKSKNLKVVIANGFQKTENEVFQRKAYGYWNEVANTMKGIYKDVSFFIVGGEDDKEWSEELADEIEAKDYCGELNILQTAAAINECDIYLGNDSSCSHISDALGKRGIVLMGSTLCSKNFSGCKTLKIIRSPMKCAACQSTVMFKECENPGECMDAISPSIIMGTIRNILKGK